MQTIDRIQAAEMIRTSKGKLFSVTFLKRTNRSKRRMTARVGVTKGVTGEGAKFNAADHDLLTVHEFVSLRDTGPNKRANLLPTVRCVETQWRSVPIEGITELRMGGKVFQVT